MYFILYQSSLHFYCQTGFHCIGVRYIYPFIRGWIFGSFPLLAIMNNAPMNISCTRVFMSLEYIPRWTLLGHCWCFKFFILVTHLKDPLLYMLHCWPFRHDQVEIFCSQRIQINVFWFRVWEVEICGMFIGLNIWCGTVYFKNTVLLFITTRLWIGVYLNNI